MSFSRKYKEESRILWQAKLTFKYKRKAVINMQELRDFFPRALSWESPREWVSNYQNYCKEINIIPGNEH